MAELKRRFSIIHYVLFVLFSPLLLPLLAFRYLQFKRNMRIAAKRNVELLEATKPISLAEQQQVSLTPIVEAFTDDPVKFRCNPGVSFLIEADSCLLLFDVGYGNHTKAFSENLAALDDRGMIRKQPVDSLFLSHFHPDHNGNNTCYGPNLLTVPTSSHLAFTPNVRCMLPAPGTIRNVPKGTSFEISLANGARELSQGCGLYTTGSLCRADFVPGMIIEEQSLVFNVANKGLVVVIGCGHATAPIILGLVRKMAGACPIHAIIGGLHFPISSSRSVRYGVQCQTVIGTGLPIWSRIGDDALAETFAAIKQAHPAKLLLSGHDSCDYSIKRFMEELAPCGIEVSLLKVGQKYSF